MGTIKKFLYLLTETLSILIPFSLAAVPTDCDFMQEFVIGQQYYVYSPRYPDIYRPGTICDWYGVSPPNTNIIISCEDVNLPSSQNCYGDKLRISLTGNRDLLDSKNYCGRGTLSLSTKKNKIAIKLYTTIASTGGRFLCTLTAVQNEDYGNQSNTDVPAPCDCGLKSVTRIVGGTATKINEFPSMAGLIDAPDPSIVCGANIISDRYVLTAAHCIAAIPLQTMAVLIGDWDISTGMDTSAAALYKAERAYVHPNFNSVQQLNDIAIVKTQGKILFSLQVNPICLPFRFSSDTFTGQNVTILGWGQLAFSGPTSDILQKVNVDVVSNDFCQEKLPGNNITKSQICTYSAGHDACQSDSGGPVIWHDPKSDRLQQIGVVSYGYACASSRPGVHTRVTSYLSWIVSTTSDAKYCIK